MEETKFCKFCERDRPKSEFYSNNRKRCKECIMQYQKSKSINKRLRKDRSVQNNIVDRTNVHKHDELIYKKCVGCQQEKLLEAFGAVKNGRYIDRKNRCIECERFKNQQLIKARRERKEQTRSEEREALMSLTYKERVAFIEKKKLKTRLKYDYGISVERHDEMLKQQNGLCAICHNPPKKYEILVTDHDHTTGYVRGLLCKECNFGLGLFRDNPENLLSAIEYLKNSTWEY